MKTTCRTRFWRGALFGIAAGVCSVAMSSAQAPADPGAPAGVWKPPPVVFVGKAQARVDVLMVRVPEETVLPMLPELRDPKRVEAAQQRLVEMISRGDAQFVDWPELTTYSGARAASYTAVQERYPCEALDGGNWGNDLPKLTLAEKHRGYLEMMGALPPTNYETKGVGTNIDLEQEIDGNQKSTTLNLAVEHVTLERTLAYPAGRDAQGATLTMKQPLFRMAKIATNLTLRDGERRLLYLGAAEGTQRQMLLFTIGVKIIPTLKPAQPVPPPPTR